MNYHMLVSIEALTLFSKLFGRRATMLGSQLLFALGSALCGSARNMNWLIAARSTCIKPVCGGVL